MYFDETPAAFDGLAGDFEVFDFIGPLPRGPVQVIIPASTSSSFVVSQFENLGD